MEGNKRGERVFPSTREVIIFLSVVSAKFFFINIKLCKATSKRLFYTSNGYIMIFDFFLACDLIQLMLLEKLLFYEFVIV